MSKGQNKTTQLSTVLIVGDRDVNLNDPDFSHTADLRVAGGTFIQKSLYIGENLNVKNKIEANTIVSNCLASPKLFVQDIIAHNIYANINVTGNVVFSNGDVCFADSVNIKSNLSVYGTLIVSNNLIVDGNLSVNQNLSVNGNLSVNNIVANGNLYANKTFTDSICPNTGSIVNIGGDGLTIDGDLIVLGNTVQNNVILSTITVPGDGFFGGNVTIQQNINVQQNANIGGETNIVGNLVVCGNIYTKSSLTIAENFVVEGDFTVLGNTTMINTETLTIEDNKILLNSMGMIPGLDGGLCINRYQEESNSCVGDVVTATPAETGTAISATINTIVLSPPTTRPIDFYNEWWIKISGGTGANQVRKIIDFVGTTNLATVQTNWQTIPDGTSNYELFSCKYAVMIWDESQDKFVFGCTPYGNGDPVIVTELADLCIKNLTANGNIIVNNGFVMVGNVTITNNTINVGNTMITQEGDIMLGNTIITGNSICVEDLKVSGNATISNLNVTNNVTLPPGALPSGIPTGSLMPYAGSSAPTDWLLCDGSAVSRTTYVDLFTVIGTVYGSGDGFSTFNIPDMRGRTPFGVDNGAGRVTSNNTLGQSSGSQSHTLSVSEIPSHSHSLPDHTHTLGSHTHSLSDHTHALGSHSHPFSGSGSTSSNTINFYHNEITDPGFPPYIPATTGNFFSPHFRSYGFVAADNCEQEAMSVWLGPYSRNCPQYVFQQAHSHSVSVSGTTGGASGTSGLGGAGTTGSASGNTGLGGSGTSGTSGSGSAHNNMPPYLMFNYIIRT